jgi:FtsP/CotA-like multicopper oxidase with cupredoxin domain
MRRVVLALICLCSVVNAPAQPAKKKLAAAAPPKLEVVVPGCEAYSGKELKNPYEIPGDGISVATTFDVRMQNNVQVPVYNGSGQCVMTAFNLRNYGYISPSVAAFDYGFPGPTLRVRKGSSTTPGGTITVKLQNNLPWPGADACNLGCQGPCNVSGAPQCCSDVSTMPDCFHGDNTTNLHFHGLHVSPQSPQDYVLLDLQPATAPYTAPGVPGPHSAHGDSGTVQQGTFTYAVNPLGPEQPEGTHWYHPHKHGSTALQVGDGMAGAVIVEGPFDDWLNGQFPKPPAEKIMVVQQIHDLNFYTSKAVFAPYPLINGQLTPVVTMYPGEIQRWRVIAATMEASAQLTIDFDGPSNSSGTVIKQIAQDGIQFDPRNYASQPLVNYPANTYNLSPGNRADFLVQAPSAVGTYMITYDVFGRVETQGNRQRQQSGRAKGKGTPIQENVRTILEKAAPGAAEPGLLSINVVACPTGTTCPAMSFPSTLPPLPPYLANIDTVDQKHDVLFSLTGAPTKQPQKFAIGVDGAAPVQFNADCANFTEPLGNREQWTLTQNQNSGIGSPFHVFHIHTNPFQVVQNAGKTYDPPIWMDSITLPDVGSNVVMRTQYTDYTGLYVLHCHFLGHEDRGMMLTVQTVCPNAPTTYGTTVASGGADNCNVPIANALPPCGTTATSAKAMNMNSTAPQARERMKKH